MTGTEMNCEIEKSGLWQHDEDKKMYKDEACYEDIIFRKKKNNLFAKIY